MAGFERARGVPAHHVEGGAVPGLVAAAVPRGDAQVEAVGPDLPPPDTDPIQKAAAALGSGDDARGPGPPPPQPDEYMRRLGTLLHQPGER